MDASSTKVAKISGDAAKIRALKEAGGDRARNPTR